MVNGLDDEGEGVALFDEVAADDVETATEDEKLEESTGLVEPVEQGHTVCVAKIVDVEVTRAP